MTQSAAQAALASNGKGLVILTAIEGGIALFLLIARVYTTWRITRHIRSDLYLSILTFVCDRGPMSSDPYLPDSKLTLIAYRSSAQSDPSSWVSVSTQASERTSQNLRRPRSAMPSSGTGSIRPWASSLRPRVNWPSSPSCNRFMDQRVARESSSSGQWVSQRYW